MLSSPSAAASKRLTIGALRNSQFRRQWLDIHLQKRLRQHDHLPYRFRLRLLGSFNSQGVSGLACTRPMAASYQALNAAATVLSRKKLSTRIAQRNLNTEDLIFQSGVHGRELAIGISTVVPLVFGYLYVTDTRA